MKLTLEILIISFALSLTSTNEIIKLESPANFVQVKKQDEITACQKYLVLNQRAVIRPIYVETVKNKTAKHTGYLFYVNLKNTAIKTSYKKIQMEISYFDKFGKLVDKEIVTLKKSIKPNQSSSEAIKLTKYKNTNYKVAILGAVALDK